MPFEFIQIPANAQGAAKEALNALLRSGRIASVRKEFVANAKDSFWAFRLMLPSCPQLRLAVPEGTAMRHKKLNIPPSSLAWEIPAHEPNAGTPCAVSAAEGVSKAPGAPIYARTLPPSTPAMLPLAPRS